jgi:hypothetical protein
MSTCCGVKVVHSNRWSSPATTKVVNGRPRRGRLIACTSASVGSRQNTACGGRNRPECGDASPRAMKSLNCGVSLEMWSTITSAITSTWRASARRSRQPPRRGSTFVWSRGLSKKKPPSR